MPNSIRILLAEDDPDILRMEAAALRPAGIDVDFADTGLEALERLSSHKYDVIVLDLAMPGYSGMMLIEHLRQSQPEMLQRTIVTTGWAARLDTADRKNVFRVLVKPFEMKALIEAIHQAALPGAELA
jgi:CheY-like chemotaxis protein